MPRWNVCPISIAVETSRLAGERHEGQVEDSEGVVRAVFAALLARDLRLAARVGGRRDDLEAAVR